MTGGPSSPRLEPPPDLELPPGAPGEALGALVALLADDPLAPIAPAGPGRIWRAHVADSLSAMEVAEVREASRIADVGSGAGLPALPLALALPESRVVLIESVRRKCEFAERAAGRVGAGNARVACERSEEHARGEGREAYDVVTARAVAPLAALLELASPLLRRGGVLVAWRGEREPPAEAEAEAIAEATAMRPERVLAAKPYEGSRNRHLHVVRKSGQTPEYLPRRPGLARKRPLAGADGPGR